jgi:hypothetical protein
VPTELGKMHEHLLAPLGVDRARLSVRAAVAAYTSARGRAEERFGAEVPRVVEEAVRVLLAAGGYGI